MKKRLHLLNTRTFVWTPKARNSLRLILAYLSGWVPVNSDPRPWMVVNGRRVYLELEV